MPLKINTVLIDETVVLTLQGSLNEYSSELQEIEVHASFDLSLDLRYLTAINSIGIRNFQKWINKIQSKRIIFLRCPRSFVHQLNLVHGFLPERSEIRSFYVTYYSEATGAEVEKLFIRGIDYDVIDGQFMLNATEVRDAYGNLMELDDIKGQYFKFLSYYK
ncbi:hypothetical protein [Bdellovibrio svalbardensis]|uniref:STAS domain-containing protein n=1 Tax=Bdellovibrio svalbardensis TaxID=2972972 RepID=A0ABT6DHH1_9BACT|nr:hypothetical protein [Bdellovibrio svalbardensis]MDG0816299.1 hypothetical protein [Bdellovibrio svalbardensis]